MATTTQSVAEVCAGAKRASRALARLDTNTKNAALVAMANALELRTGEILDANARDMQAGEESGLHSGLLDRLKLTEERLAGIAADVRSIAALPDPVGETIEGFRLPNGLDVRRVRVPLGVVAVVYEARPNVTVDCSALCLKSGNAIVLRGSSTAAHSNAVLAQVASTAVVHAGVPEGAISIVTGGDRDELRQIATQDGLVDLVIPRGGEGLKAALKEHATVPVMYAAAGNCHVFVDATADLDDAVEIAVNAKVQRPSVCNAAETLLVHADVAGEYLPRALRELRERGVELRVDGRTRAVAGGLADSLADASEDDWSTEYHALILAVKVVDTAEEAIDHVNRYGSGHSEAIVTGSTASARAFTEGVDAACVYVNASTRFTDGAVF
ncbi:MAG: glutamate-5-semialdehyde dehydrogenase, partial [Thermoleophilaceae bacterium]